MSHSSPSHMTIDITPASPRTRGRSSPYRVVDTLSDPASPTSRRRNRADVYPDTHRADSPSIFNRNKRELTGNNETNPENSYSLQPLIEKDATNPLPPIAGPENDDLEGDVGIPATADSHPGVDDGLFEPAREHDDGLKDDRNHAGDDHNPGQHEGQDNHENPKDDVDHGPMDRRGRFNPDDGNLLEKLIVDEVDAGYYGGGFESYPMTPYIGSRNGPFPYAPDFSPGMVPRIIPDVNVYQQKKNLAQGMMDLALLSANANQLRYVLESAKDHPYFYPSLIFIAMSLVLQVAVGVGLIWNGRYNIKNEDDICRADKINNYTVIGIFLITIVAVGVGLILNGRYNIKDEHEICCANKINNYTVIGIFLITIVNVFISSFSVVAVGVGLIWNSRFNIKNEDDICRADKINNYTIIGIFLVTIVNVFVASFGVTNMSSQPSLGTPRSSNFNNNTL